MIMNKEQRNKVLAAFHLNQLERIDALLTAQGVPSWLSPESLGAPYSSPAERLEWYLARRKKVSSSEVDGRL